MKLFTEVAARQPIITSELVEFSAKSARAEIRPLPDQTPIKGYLRRTVQLVKRHRSIHFEKQPDLAPISIILTTLAMRAYAKIVSERRACKPRAKSAAGGGRKVSHLCGGERT